MWPFKPKKSQVVIPTFADEKRETALRVFNVNVDNFHREVLKRINDAAEAGAFKTYMYSATNEEFNPVQWAVLRRLEKLGFQIEINVSHTRHAVGRNETREATISW